MNALAVEGDHEAGLAFAELVFDGKYGGDEAAVKTKKEAKDIARKSAFEFVKAASDAEHLDGMIRWASVKFHGVREPGPHGSQLAGALYGESEELYKRLFEHPSCPSNRQAEFLIGQAQSIDFKSRYKGLDRQAEVFELLQKALKVDGNSKLADFILAGIHWDKGEYEKAVIHAKSCCDAYPFAALILQKASRNGLGVDKDESQAQSYYAFWLEKTDPKNRRKKSGILKNLVG